jgi:hypothetical protein
VWSWLRRALIRRRVVEDGSAVRRVRVQEELPSDRFVLSIWLMILFFAGLVGLELVHILVFGEWNQAIFDGIMLIIGALLGSLFGYREA